MASRHERLGGLFLAAVLVLAACFEPPVRHALYIEVRPDLSATLALAVAVAPSEDAAGNARLAQRLESARRDLMGRSGDWGLLFESLEPLEQETRWLERQGELVAFERRVVVADTGELAAFFAPLGIGFFLERDGTTASLALYPSAPARATRRQRQEVDELLDAWSESLAAYTAAAGELFAYLERQPDRALALFSELFSDVLSTAREYQLSDGERELLDSLEAPMEEVLEVLVVDSQRAFSLDEISHLVYDPFPARVSVDLPAPILEIEGFEQVGERSVAIGGFGLWRSLSALEESWVRPPLLQSFVAAETADEGEPGLDVASLASRPRAARTPLSAFEIRAALEQRLEPPPVYRVEWAAAQPAP